ncbi:MAG: ankyrin repeat domain-containing protein, partial [Acidobacteriota bacterium]
AARAERASGPQGLRPTRPGDRPSGSFSPVAKPLFGAEPQRLSAPGSSRSSSSRSAGASAFDALFSAPDAGQPAPIDPHQLEGVDRFGAFLENAPVLARRMIDFGDLEGDESNDQGESLLMLAAAAGEAEIVRVLLGKSVEIDLQDASENGETALLKAVQTPSRGRLEVLDLLVDAGADLERRHGAKERTPLMFAALSDIYTPDTYARQFGQTTLHLVRLGARLDAEDADGQRPVDIITQAAQEAPANSPMRNRLLDMQAILERAGG